MHSITIHNLYAETVFELFHKLVAEEGGDGAGAIVCGNPKESAELFVKYIRRNVWEKFAHSLKYDEYEKDGKIFCNWHDNNENFIFTNDVSIDLVYDSDTVWYIENDCYAGHVPYNSDKGEEAPVWIRGIK